MAADEAEEPERRLIEAPGEIATKDLAVISGISADKAAKYEGWGKQIDSEPGSSSKLLDRLEAALEKITERHPELGAHLSATIRRGYACAYVPDPRVLVDWEV